jgi:hypothetical protein
MTLFFCGHLCPDLTEKIARVSTEVKTATGIVVDNQNWTIPSWTNL